jgi:hypothetical protein
VVRTARLPIVARAEIDRFLEDAPREAVSELRNLLEAELRDSDRLAIVECGEHKERALLRYTEAGNDLQFYSLDVGDSTYLNLMRVARPHGAQVTLVRELRESTLLVARLIAQHPALPYERIECDLYRLGEAEHAGIADLFHSWVRAA